MTWHKLPVYSLGELQSSALLASTWSRICWYMSTHVHEQFDAASTDSPLAACRRKSFRRCRLVAKLIPTRLDFGNSVRPAAWFSTGFDLSSKNSCIALNSNTDLAVYLLQCVVCSRRWMQRRRRALQNVCRSFAAVCRKLPATQRRLWVHKISILPLNSLKMRDFEPKILYFWKKIFRQAKM